MYHSPRLIEEDIDVPIRVAGCCQAAIGGLENKDYYERHVTQETWIEIVVGVCRR